MGSGGHTRATASQPTHIYIYISTHRQPITFHSSERWSSLRCTKSAHGLGETICLGGGQCGGRGLSRSAFGRRAEPSNRTRREAEGRTFPDRDDAAPAGALGKRGGTLIGTRLPSALGFAGIGMLGVGGRSGSAESSCISTCHGQVWTSKKPSCLKA